MLLRIFEKAGQTFVRDIFVYEDDIDSMNVVVQLPLSNLSLLCWLPVFLKESTLS